MLISQKMQFTGQRVEQSASLVCLVTGQKMQFSGQKPAEQPANLSRVLARTCTLLTRTGAARLSQSPSRLPGLAGSPSLVGSQLAWHVYSLEHAVYWPEDGAASQFGVLSYWPKHPVEWPESGAAR